MPPALVTTLATWPDRPGMSSLAPSTISMRTTLAAGILAQLAEHVVGLARQALPVQQHVAGRLAHAAFLHLFADHEAGHLHEHVQRVARR